MRYTYSKLKISRDFFAVCIFIYPFVGSFIRSIANLCCCCCCLISFSLLFSILFFLLFLFFIIHHFPSLDFRRFRYDRLVRSVAYALLFRCSIRRIYSFFVHHRFPFSSIRFSKNDVQCTDRSCVVFSLHLCFPIFYLLSLYFFFLCVCREQRACSASGIQHDVAIVVAVFRQHTKTSLCLTLRYRYTVYVIRER